MEADAVVDVTSCLLLIYKDDRYVCVTKAFDLIYSGLMCSGEVKSSQVMRK